MTTSRVETPRTDIERVISELRSLGHEHPQVQKELNKAAFIIERDMATALREKAEAEHERDMARDEFREARKTSYLERAEQAELALATLTERAEQLCYEERDKADSGKWQDASGHAWQLGFAFACNLLGKKLRALAPKAQT